MSDELRALELHRDGIATRIERITNDPYRWRAGTTFYPDEARANEARGLLVDILTQHLDSINAEIGKMIEVRV
jgi:hypothetical protein